ncbi:hypothetical protein [Halorubellus sp. PRR65]|uniref:hypothetical protein n=1 Tax=Halorubellus sp. PRR65 TaxID=3098148 RepID=UPI002B257327|nr:hypothetical protein [Halorubellus sp. PRR65]
MSGGRATRDWSWRNWLFAASSSSESAATALRGVLVGDVRDEHGHAVVARHPVVGDDAIDVVLERVDGVVDACRRLDVQHPYGRVSR